MLRSVIATLAAFTSTAVLAHAGHDHSHWLSEPIHALSVVAIASIVGISVFALARKHAKQKQKNK